MESSTGNYKKFLMIVDENRDIINLAILIHNLLHEIESSGFRNYVTEPDALYSLIEEKLKVMIVRFLLIRIGVAISGES